MIERFHHNARLCHFWSTDVSNLNNIIRQLRWKLTLSYMAVTAGALLVVVLILGTLVFSRILIPDGFFTPHIWNELANEQMAPVIRHILAQSPIDTDLIALIFSDSDATITSDDLFRIGDTQFSVRTATQTDVLIVGADGSLLGVSNPALVPGAVIGQPFDADKIPGLNLPLQAALAGEEDPERLFATIEPNDKFVFAIPVFSDDGDEKRVLGAVVVNFESLPTESDFLPHLVKLVGKSLLIFIVGAGIMGAIFGFPTANGMVKRFRRLSAVADAWSRGDFSEFIDDPTGDEIGHLARRLNRMAEQLQNLLKRRQEMAVSEERNRLARDLHDSAKQQALAASFQLGTVITLFDRDPQSAKDHLMEADNLVDSVRRELTDLIHELRPPMMNGQDFAETLNEYGVEWAHQNEIEIDVNVQGHGELPLEIKQTLYRIMQEALANIARHSAASSAGVSLNYDTTAATLTITDDGCGFDTDEQHDGMGLYSMRERAESLNGAFTIESKPGQGAKICVTLGL